jgi:hypothetical protein
MSRKEKNLMLLLQDIIETTNDLQPYWMRTQCQQHFNVLNTAENYRTIYPSRLQFNKKILRTIKV